MLEILTYHVTVQPSASLLRNLPIPDRLRRGADSLLVQFTRSHGLCSKRKVLAELLPFFLLLLAQLYTHTFQSV